LRNLIHHNNFSSKSILILFFFFGGFFQVFGQTVTLSIEGIRLDKGVVAFGVYRNQKQFDEDKPEIKKVFAKKNLKSGKLTVQFQLTPGMYGIALLDDENNDRKMNYNMIGMPKEGFGFSNYNSSGLSKPNFSDFDFEVKPGENKVNIKMRYIL